MLRVIPSLDTSTNLLSKLTFGSRRSFQSKPEDPRPSSSGSVCGNISAPCCRFTRTFGLAPLLDAGPQNPSDGFTFLGRQGGDTIVSKVTGPASHVLACRRLN
jgi:hypothetical protein